MPLFTPSGRSVRHLPLVGDVALARARGARALEERAGPMEVEVVAVGGVGVAAGVEVGVEGSVAAVEAEVAVVAVEAVGEAVEAVAAVERRWRRRGGGGSSSGGGGGDGGGGGGGGAGRGALALPVCPR
ncbi:unnamed protein product [Closterium sp. NIES-65]|nr:unnamed protein product [Closterium sp. NIES-65]